MNSPVGYSTTSLWAANNPTHNANIIYLVKYRFRLCAPRLVTVLRGIFRGPGNPWSVCLIHAASQGNTGLLRETAPTTNMQGPSPGPGSINIETSTLPHSGSYENQCWTLHRLISSRQCSPAQSKLPSSSQRLAFCWICRSRPWTESQLVWN
jgi:hypothetical protein